MLIELLSDCGLRLNVDTLLFKEPVLNSGRILDHDTEPMRALMARRLIRNAAHA